MSKKKTKTRIEKTQTVHHFDHIAKSNSFIVKSDNSKNTSEKKSTVRSESPLTKSIAKDLKYTTIVILSFVVAISLLAYIVYKTDLLDPLLSFWNIKY